jgi:hypothetical protein
MADDMLFDEDEIDYATASDYFSPEELEQQRIDMAARDAEMAERVARQEAAEARWTGTPGVDRGWSGNPTGFEQPPQQGQGGAGQPQEFRFGQTGVFNVDANPHWQWANQASATGVRSGDTLMNQGFKGLTTPITAPNVAAPPPLTAPTPTNVVSTSDVRDTQKEAIDLALARARGEEPGIGQALMGEGAVQTRLTRLTARQG